MGLMKFSCKGVEALKNVFYESKKTGMLQGKPVENAYMTGLLQEIINSWCKVNSVTVNGGWVEVDTVDDYLSEVTKERLQIRPVTYV